MIISTIYRYFKLLKEIDSMKIYDGSKSVLYDIYECDTCELRIYTYYAVKGVTPFSIGCPRCSAGIMQHNKSSHDPRLRLHAKRWIRPTLWETLHLNKGEREHVLNGGLLLEGVHIRKNN